MEIGQAGIDGEEAGGPRDRIDSIDYGDKAGWVDCFTADGAYELRYHDRERFGLAAFPYGEPVEDGIRFTGAAALRAFVDQHSHAPDAWHKHILVEPQIGLAPDRRSAHVAS
ncbi:MAG: hypothetical protein JOY99_11600 [Sphingomonadaceae bacterium]|nr:hypothetical protein [Sphingomonadaceae bacterium]